jgi:PHD/YefM family antitoxin component YafN of YafNO toxin-antitoxin module
MNQRIRDAVFEARTWLEKGCHSRVVEAQSDELARYSRLNAACDALGSFVGSRPEIDETLFTQLSECRAAVADVLASANLEAWIEEVDPGLYLAIPFFSRCSDKQPVWFVNRTQEEIIYIGRRLYAFATDDDGITDYSASSSAFADRIASASRLASGEKLKIDDYSMSFDGDFMGNHRIVIMQHNEQIEMRALVGKLGGHLWRGEGRGIHLLKSAPVKL